MSDEFENSPGIDENLKRHEEATAFLDEFVTDLEEMAQRGAVDLTSPRFGKARDIVQLGVDALRKGDLEGADLYVAEAKILRDDLRNGLR